jgi:hypothetical protein
MEQREICKYCGGEMEFICHSQEWESPVHWCLKCGALAVTPKIDIIGKYHWMKPGGEGWDTIQSGE